MKRNLLITLLLVTCVIFLIFLVLNPKEKLENQYSHLSSFRLIINLEKNIDSGKCLTIEPDSLNSKEVSNLLKEYHISKILAVFRNRYSKSGNLIHETNESTIYRQIIINDSYKANELAKLLLKAKGVKEAYIESSSGGTIDITASTLLTLTGGAASGCHAYINSAGILTITSSNTTLTGGSNATAHAYLQSGNSINLSGVTTTALNGGAVAAGAAAYLKVTKESGGTISAQTLTLTAGASSAAKAYITSSKADDSSFYPLTSNKFWAL